MEKSQQSSQDDTVTGIKPVITIDEERKKLEERLIELEGERDKLTNRGYIMLLEQIPILAIPAVASVFLANFLSAQFEIPKEILLPIFLISALILSWKIIFMRMNTFQTTIRKVINEIKAIKKITEPSV